MSCISRADDLKSVFVDHRDVDRQGASVARRVIVKTGARIRSAFFSGFSTRLYDFMRWCFAVACSAAVLGCGGGYSQQPPTPGPPTLALISVSPANASLLLGTNHQ